MSFSSGSQRDLYYVLETTYGDGGGATPSVSEIRNKDDSISLARDNYVSEERRGDRGIHDMRLGNKQPAGDISFELSYGSFDDFMRLALGDSAWVAAYSPISADCTVVASTKKITRASGSWIADGVKIGDSITFAGFSAPANDQEMQVTAISATDLTFANSTGLVDEAVAATVTATTSATIIKKGTTVDSVAVEKVFSDIGEYQFYTGGIVNTMSLDIRPNGMIAGSFGMLFKDHQNAQAAFHSGSPSSVSTARPFDAFTGYIIEDDSSLAVASGLNFSLDNGFTRNFVLMQNTAPQMTSGKSNITGSTTLYFEDSTLYDKFVNEVETSIEFQLMDNNYNAYVFTLPRVKYTTADIPVNNDDALILTMNFQALDDATQASNIVIRKQPAVVA